MIKDSCLLGCGNARVGLPSNGRYRSLSLDTYGTTAPIVRDVGSLKPLMVSQCRNKLGVRPGLRYLCALVDAPHTHTGATDRSNRGVDTDKTPSTFEKGERTAVTSKPVKGRQRRAIFETSRPPRRTPARSNCSQRTQMACPHRGGGGPKGRVDLHLDRLSLERNRPELFEFHQLPGQPGRHRVHHYNAVRKPSRSESTGA